MALPESTRDRHHRMRHLHFKATQGTITEPERREMAALDDWYYKTFGFHSAQPDTLAGARDQAVTQPLLGTDIEGGGGANEVEDNEAQLAGAGSYKSFGDWMAAMNTPQGKAQLNTVSALLSPLSAPIRVVSGLLRTPTDPLGVNPGTHTGLGEQGGNTGWGYSIDENTGAVTDAQTGQTIDYTSPGSSIEGGYGGGLDAGDTASGPGSVDATGGFGVGDDPSGGGWDSSGGFGDEGSDDDDGGGFDGGLGYRHGGYTGLGRDRKLQRNRRAGAVHEGEYVLRNEAVEKIGIPALDMLNRMGKRRGRGLMFDRRLMRVRQEAM